MLVIETNGECVLLKRAHFTEALTRLLRQKGYPQR
jgi:hypothetical protein